MTDLERFFRQLVANLAASDPARLHHPIPLEDIQESIVPYRSNRRALHLDSSEDYEMVLLRLCAGEGNLVRTEPEQARVRFAEELGSPNPDLDVLHKIEHVVVSLRSEPLARALEPEPDEHLPYAPPSFSAPPVLPRRHSTFPSSTRWSRSTTWSAKTLPDEHEVAGAPHCLLLRRHAARRPGGALLPALRPASGASGVPPLSQRGRARLATLRELRGGARGTVSRAGADILFR